MIRFFLSLFFLCATAFAADPTFPELTGRVVDQADLLTVQQEQSLAQLSQTVEDNSTVQLVVVTLKSLEGYEIAEYGYQLGRHWKIGQKGEDNGILIIVAPHERKARIEVGYGLEGYLTDAQAHEILREVLLPRFKENDFFGGLHSTMEEIRTVLSQEYKSAHRASSPEGTHRFYWIAVAFIPFLFFSFRQKNREPHQRPHSWKRFLGALFNGGITGIVAWFISHILLLSGIVGVIVFIVSYFADRHHDFGSVLDEIDGSSGPMSSDSFDIFSGGGGSFGGGGASIDF